MIKIFLGKNRKSNHENGCREWSQENRTTIDLLQQFLKLQFLPPDFVVLITISVQNVRSHTELR